MLEHTFVHIPGIGSRTERRLWNQGITTLCQLLEQFEADECFQETRNRPYGIIEQSLNAIEDKNWHFFLGHLPSNEHWRVLTCFANPAYLDIETTGLDPVSGHITTIGLYNGTELKSYVHGRNLDTFKHDITGYDAVITYNGKAFDLPFINTSLGVRIDLPHVDLRYPLANLGYKGGLKAIEKKLDIVRHGPMKDINGYMAVMLWNEYTAYKNERALDTLLAYNLEDIINLKPLAEKTYNLNLERLPDCFQGLMVMETSMHPSVPYTVDARLVRSLHNRMFENGRK